MPLTVLSVSYPLAPVSESTAGGAEQVLAMLDEGLTGAGHRSLVIAQGGSQCRGTLLPVKAPGFRLDEDVHALACIDQRAAIKWALTRFAIDIVHLHGLDFVDYLPEAGPPVVVTVHLPISFYPRQAFQLSRPDTHLVCVSESQAWTCPAGAKIWGVIRNGVRLDPYQPPRVKGNYVFALGRICPEKGFDIALDAATECGIPLVLAGTVFGYASHQQYFEDVIRPRLTGDHRFIGAIGLKAKRELLAGARCVVIPSLVEETSSLVAMEAMACGTPVVAFKRGALTELVEHGRTGLLVDSRSEMAAAMEAAGNLSSSLCREYAEKHFASDEMVRQYLALYSRLAASSRVHIDSDIEKVA
ncbi:MAG: glycosyltransferase family 4 protein [Acidobacteria bacterium]|nr:MAG: glycosyltransferase family 4 protein [Acidobacteriota bacterium]